jgi:FkbM family methyltransferase
MTFLRPGTYDAAIWHSVLRDYPTLPASFSADEIVLDIGSHTGAFCKLAADRGARVVGYEANRENHALARMNLFGSESVSLFLTAVWRSDEVGSQLLYTPAAAPDNTGGGSVLFTTAEDHRKAFPGQSMREISEELRQSSHAVPTKALDEILRTVGPVRFMKIDVEGAEFPILLTASELRWVSEISGEYHDFTDLQMEQLAPSAVVGQERYSANVLSRHLEAAGFRVAFRPAVEGRGLFEAQRRS